MSQNVKISVIVPCYNQDMFLIDTLDSILNQTYTNWECIAVNDGSTDNTKDIIKIFCERDNRFIYLQKENGGLSSARNAGLKVVTGDFIQFLDSDDIISKNKFEIQLKSLAMMDADVLVSDYNLFARKSTNQFDTDLSQKPYDFTLEGFLYKWIDLDFVIAIHCALFRREFLVSNNIKFEEGVDALEDWIFWCNVYLHNARFSHQTEKLAHYRCHKASMSYDLSRMRNANFTAAFYVEAILPENMRLEFRDKISKILVNRIAISLGESINSKKANSLEYRTGYVILYPLHKISHFLKTLIRRLSEKSE